jgi:hypothetical protein
MAGPGNPAVTNKENLSLRHICFVLCGVFRKIKKENMMMKKTRTRLFLLSCGVPLILCAAASAADRVVVVPLGG